MDIFMQAAISEALEGLSEGGVPIGAILVEKGRIIGRGRNRRVQDQDQLMHAEMDCLRHARLTGGYHYTTLYSTLMPCYLCAGAMVQFGIEKVVVGEAKRDPAAIHFILSHGRIALAGIVRHGRRGLSATGNGSHFSPQILDRKSVV